jgi:hypothetical protein
MRESKMDVGEGSEVGPRFGGAEEFYIFAEINWRTKLLDPVE